MKSIYILSLGAALCLQSTDLMAMEEMDLGALKRAYKTSKNSNEFSEAKKNNEKLTFKTVKAQKHSNELANLLGNGNVEELQTFLQNREAHLEDRISRIWVCS